MRPSLRNRLLFVEQNKLPIFDLAVLDAQSVENFIWKTDDVRLKWIENTTEEIGNWRSFIRSVYIRWAITINALNVAKDHYKNKPNVGLVPQTWRWSEDGPKLVNLVVWPGPQASNNYNDCIPLMAAYGVQDLYGALEEVIFSLYETYLRANPDSLLKGPDFKDLRKLRRDQGLSENDQVKYNLALEHRLDMWRRKRSYDGLHKVFRAYWQITGLSVPSWRALNVDDLVLTIESIAEVRHLVTHGEDKVSKRLAEISTAQPQFGFDFVEGDQLNVTLEHLMLVENFMNSVLDVLNVSLIEKGIGYPLPSPKAAVKPAT